MKLLPGQWGYQARKEPMQAFPLIDLRTPQQRRMAALRAAFKWSRGLFSRLRRKPVAAPVRPLPGTAGAWLDGMPEERCAAVAAVAHAIKRAKAKRVRNYNRS